MAPAVVLPEERLGARRAPRIPRLLGLGELLGVVVGQRLVRLAEIRRLVQRRAEDLHPLDLAERRLPLQALRLVLEPPPARLLLGRIERAQAVEDRPRLVAQRPGARPRRLDLRPDRAGMVHDRERALAPPRAVEPAPDVGRERGRVRVASPGASAIARAQIAASSAGTSWGALASTGLIPPVRGAPQTAAGWPPYGVAPGEDLVEHDAERADVARRAEAIAPRLAPAPGPCRAACPAPRRAASGAASIASAAPAASRRGAAARRGRARPQSITRTSPNSPIITLAG